MKKGKARNRDKKMDKMKKIRNVLIGLIVLANVGCNNANNKPSLTDAADIIYFDGDIVTMEGDSVQYAEAGAVKNGKIVFVGSKIDADKLKGDSTSLNDLMGKTLLPGFIDPHSHFMSSLAMTTQANCQPAPAGAANDIPGIIKALQEAKIKYNIKEGNALIGYGYDENAMPNGILLNRDDLDKAFCRNN